MEKVYMNNVLIPTEFGTTVTTTSNEILNTSLFTTLLIDKLDIKPLQTEFRIEVGGNNIFYGYASNVKTKVFDGIKKYKYIVTLISPMIKLQRIPLPNRSITKSLVGANKTIYDVVKNYRDMYCPWLILHESLNDILNKECPEFQWNRPTFYEVLLDLFEVVDRIPTLANFNTLVSVDRKRKGKPININDINYVEIEQSVENTSDRLEIEAENVYYDYANTRTPVSIAPKTESGAILKTDNAILILDKPIFKINKAICVFPIQASDGELDEIISVDITSKIVEKKAYDLCKISNSIGTITGNYKRDRLYFVEGDNKIQGLAYDEKAFIGSARLALANILIGITNNTRISENDLLNASFYLVYSTTDNVKFRVIKDYQDGNDSILIDNQENSNVDLLALAKREKNLINRLSGKQVNILGKFYNNIDVFRLNDIYDNNYYIAQLTKTFQNTFINVSAIGIQNDIQRHEFTGINSKKRYTQLAGREESFVSNHLEEVHFDFSLNNGSVDPLFENFMLKFGIISNLPLAVVEIIGKSFVLNTSTYMINNGIVITFKMHDNASAGPTVIKNDILGTLEMDYAQYVDYRGEFKELSYYLYQNFVNEDQSSYANYLTSLIKARKFPQVDEDLIVINEQFKFYESPILLRYKDNREITAETVQLFFNSNSDVVVGEKFIELSPITSHSIINSFNIYKSTTETYIIGDNYAKGELLGTSSLIRADNYISMTDYNLSGATSWCIADSNGRLILGINSNANKIYLKRR